MRDYNNVREYNYSSIGRHNMAVNNRRRKQRKSKRTKNKSIFRLTTIITLLLVLITAFVVLGNPKQVKADETEYYKYFQFYKVESGDTLWSLANSYAKDKSDVNAYIKEVIQSNHIKNYKIYEGETLVIPYYLTYIK